MYNIYYAFVLLKDNIGTIIVFATVNVKYIIYLLGMKMNFDI